MPPLDSFSSLKRFLSYQNWGGFGDFKKRRLENFVECLERFDIILLQEMFEFLNPRTSFLLQEAEKRGFHYHVRSGHPTILSKQLIDSGLIILSRYPIISQQSINYNKGTGADGMCAKGVLYARVLLGEGPDAYAHVFNTHLQSTTLDPISLRYRSDQLAMMGDFMQSILSGGDGQPVVVGGDFNIDAIPQRSDGKTN